MQWVTRERPKVDRVACPWLIQRFIDEKAEFLFAPPGDVARVARETGAVPFDIEGVPLSRLFTDDHAQLRHGFVMYDALYAWLVGARDAPHIWNPQNKAVRALGGHQPGGA